LLPLNPTLGLCFHSFVFRVHKILSNKNSQDCTENGFKNPEVTEKKRLFVARAIFSGMLRQTDRQTHKPADTTDHHSHIRYSASMGK